MPDQTDFTAALLDPDLAVPQGLTGPDGRPAGRRFSVYRNNVAVSLGEAMEVAFPVLQTLVGGEFFRAMVGVYIREHPPQTPLMMHYGIDFPDFLEGFAPAQHLGYLPDIARLELARRESYHAADAVPVSPDALAALAPDLLVQIRIGLAPALRVLRSAYPVGSIWLAHQDSAASNPGMQAEDVLITRPDFDPVVTLLPDGGATFIATLQAGLPLGEAISSAGPDFTNSNLSHVLGLLLSGNAIIKIQDDKL